MSHLQVMDDFIEKRTKEFNALNDIFYNYFRNNSEMGSSYHHPRDTVGSLRDCDCHPYFLKELKVSLIHCKDEEYNWNLKMQ